MAWLFQIEAPCLPSPLRGGRGAARRVRALFKSLSSPATLTATLSRKREMGRKKGQTQATKRDDGIAVSLNRKRANHPKFAPLRIVRGDRNGIEFTKGNAEELGVDSNNVDESRSRTIPRSSGFRAEGDFGKSLNAPNDWAYQIVIQVGNCAEAFARSLGSGSLMKINHDLNRVWKEGDLQQAPPIR
jgi:hypothetical protein